MPEWEREIVSRRGKNILGLLQQVRSFSGVEEKEHPTEPERIARLDRGISSEATLRRGRVWLSVLN
jgi:hypothetical protein